MPSTIMDKLIHLSEMPPESDWPLKNKEAEILLIKEYEHLAWEKFTELAGREPTLEEFSEWRWFLLAEQDKNDDNAAHDDIPVMKKAMKITAYKTPDGSIFEYASAAKNHMEEQEEYTKNAHDFVLNSENFKPLLCMLNVYGCTVESIKKQCPDPNDPLFMASIFGDINEVQEQIHKQARNTIWGDVCRQLLNRIYLRLFVKTAGKWTDTKQDYLINGKERE